MTPEEWVDKIMRDLAFKAPELWDGYLRVCIKTAIEQNLTPAPPAEQFVVVTRFGEIVHAYGSGPITSPGVPFSKRTQANALVTRMAKEERADRRTVGDPSDIRTCKILGSESVRG